MRVRIAHDERNKSACAVLTLRLLESLMDIGLRGMLCHEASGVRLMAML